MRKKKQGVLDPKAKAWQKKNPWFGKLDVATGVALATHSRLIRRGFDPKSDKYYAAIDRRMKRYWKEAHLPVVLSKAQAALAKKLGIPLKRYAKVLVMLDKAVRKREVRAKT